MSYRRRASPLHAARAGAGCAYCAALACAALLLSSPVALGAVVVAMVGAGIAAGAGPGDAAGGAAGRCRWRS